MAEVVAISLEVDSGNSVNEVKRLEIEVSNLIDETNDLRSINNDFKTELSQLTKEYEKMPKMALAGKKAIKVQMDELKNSIKDNNLALQDFRLKKQQKNKLISDIKLVRKQSEASIKSVGNIAKSVGAGYQAFLGVSALIGSENEDIMRSLQKLQGVQATLNAVEKISIDLQKQSTFRKSLDNVATKVKTGLNWLLAGSIKVVNGALKSLRGALIATGLGALIVLIGTIIAKWDDWKDSIIKIINVAFTPFIKVLQYLGVIESDLEKERRTNHEKEMQRIQERRDALGSVRDKAEQDLKNEIAIANARGENTDKSQKKLLKLTRDNAQKRIDDNNALLEEIESGNRVATEDEYKNTQDSIIADRKLRDGASQDLKVFDATKSKERRDAGKVSSDKKTEAQKKEDELMLQLQRDLADIIIENERDEDVRALARLKLNQERALEDLRLKYGLETELEKELLINQDNEMNELIDSIELSNKEKADAKAQKEKEERDKLKKQNDKDSSDRIKQERNEAESIIGFKQDILMNSVQAFSQLSNLLSKNEKLQKGAALAEIATGTAIGFINALDIAQKSAKATGPAAAFAMPVFYASQVVAVLGAASKARSLLGGGGGVTAPSISVPSRDTSTINSQSTNADAPGFNPATNRVVLVESDLRMMQERRNNSEIISTI